MLHGRLRRALEKRVRSKVGCSCVCVCCSVSGEAHFPLQMKLMPPLRTLNTPQSKLHLLIPMVTGALLPQQLKVSQRMLTRKKVRRKRRQQKGDRRRSVTMRRFPR